MLFSEYLHEKAEESRHNEIIGYFITVIGSIFFVGGLLETATTVQNPEWFLIFPYNFAPNPYIYLGYTLTGTGIILFCAGLSLSSYYARERSWYMEELHKSHSLEQQRFESERKSRHS